MYIPLLNVFYFVNIDHYFEQYLAVCFFLIVCFKLTECIIHNIYNIYIIVYNSKRATFYSTLECYFTLYKFSL